MPISILATVYFIKSNKNLYPDAALMKHNVPIHVLIIFRFVICPSIVFWLSSNKHNVLLSDSDV